MNPINRTLNATSVGTNALVFFPDWMQNPFNVAINCILTAAATWAIQGTRDFATTSMPTWNGSSNVTWTDISAATVTATMQQQITAPWSAIRVIVPEATDTATLKVNIMQVVLSP